MTMENVLVTLLVAIKFLKSMNLSFFKIMNIYFFVPMQSFDAKVRNFFI